MSSQWSGGVVPPPPGVTPNFIDPPDQMTKNIAVHAVFLTFSTLTLVMRVYTRLRINQMKFGVDDYLAIIAWASAVTFTGVLFTSMSYGLGRHMWDVPNTWIIACLKYQTLGSYIYTISATAVKLSLMFLYRRLFTLQLPTKIAVNGGIIVCGLLNFGLLMGIVFFCIPVQKAWNDALDGHCSDPAPLSYTTGACNVFFDIYVLLIPVPMVWGLNMGKRRKASLAAIFGIGTFACIASAVRLGMTPVLQSSFDATWNMAAVSTWATIEINVGLTCSCLLLLPAFLRHHLPDSVKDRLRSITTKSKSSHGSSNKRPARAYMHQISSVEGLVDVESGNRILRTDSFVMESVSTRV